MTLIVTLIFALTFLFLPFSVCFCFPFYIFTFFLFCELLYEFVFVCPDVLVVLMCRFCFCSCVACWCFPFAIVFTLLHVFAIVLSCLPCVSPRFPACFRQFCVGLHVSASGLPCFLGSFVFWGCFCLCFVVVVVACFFVCRDTVPINTSAASLELPTHV